ncbi:MAG: RraA family protein [Planctomycetota bacterium]|nr:MAG: RraA family protein [Planctomycetota bacterium]
MAQLWKDDAGLFSIIRQELTTAVVGEVLDELGMRNQFLPPGMTPLDPKTVLVGRAMPVLHADCCDPYSPSGVNPSFAKPFGLMLEALDDLRAGEVYVAGGGGKNLALWNELMTLRAIKLQAAGAVINACVRDSHALDRLQFPIFSRGVFGQDQRTRSKVVGFRVAVEMDGVRIRPGDLVFGDAEGVCIIPGGAESDVVHQALERAQKRLKVRQAIEAGDSAVQVFNKYNLM